ncbi:MAG: hypothetical protein OHK0013_13230 [Sandaracinaceae bacterium]
MRPHVSLAALALAFAVVGCNGSSGLTVSGTVAIDASGTPTGFRFEQPARLDGAAPAGSITGACTLTRSPGSPAFGILVDLYGPDAAQGRALRSLTLMTRTDASASSTVEAELGAETFRGTCDVAVPLANERGEVSLRASGCSISHGAETATVDLSLDLVGCTVVVE